MSNQSILVTCECAPNIALIKYWGKLDEELILPLNGSISISLDRNVICSKTSLMLVHEETYSLDPKGRLKKIQIRFGNLLQEFDEPENAETNESDNKKEKELISKKRFMSMLNKVRENCSLDEPYSYHIRIITKNNFPTACGLASSASGFACLAHCLAKAFKYNGDTSELARLGSGSACRSCYGGFVKWNSSTKSNESIATRLFKPDHWPQLNILALILEENRKDVSSTDGMHTTTLTSDLLKYRVKIVEEERLDKMINAIEQKDFNAVGSLAIKDSNCFHAVCMDTYPPLFYLNEKSKEIIRLINEFNKFEQSNSNDLKAFYSFDAGPNAFLFVLDKHIHELLYLIYKFYFSHLNEKDFFTKSLVKSKQINSANLNIDEFSNDLISSDRKKMLQSHFLNLKGFSISNKPNESSTNENNLIVKYLIHSKVGDEPILKTNNEDSTTSP